MARRPQRAAWALAQHRLTKDAMARADFLLSACVQAILKISFAEPARAFGPAELAKLARCDLPEVEQCVAHLLDSSVLARADAATPQDTLVVANTAFVFYPELRRIALKSFAAAEPLRAMLQSRFRAEVLRAFVLGEDAATGQTDLLLVHGPTAPDKGALEAALHRLLATGAIRQHVQAQVIAERRFAALRPGDALHMRLASDSCVDISPTPPRRAKAPAPRPGLLERARRRLAGRG